MKKTNKAWNDFIYFSTVITLQLYKPHYTEIVTTLMHFSIIYSGPCTTRQQTDSDVNCDRDGKFDAKQCNSNNVQGSSGVECWCTRDDGTEELGTRRVVDNKKKFKRNYCLKKGVNWPMHMYVFV